MLDLYLTQMFFRHLKVKTKTHHSSCFVLISFPEFALLINGAVHLVVQLKRARNHPVFFFFLVTYISQSVLLILPSKYSLNTFFIPTATAMMGDLLYFTQLSRRIKHVFVTSLFYRKSLNISAFPSE